MSIISRQDLEPIQESFRERLWAAQDSICKEIVAGFESRQVLIERKFKGADGEFVLHEVAVAVTGARIGYDGELILIGTYAHPVGGRLQETEFTP